jgi:hypothetical protein
MSACPFEGVFSSILRVKERFLHLKTCILRISQYVDSIPVHIRCSLGQIPCFMDYLFCSHEVQYSADKATETMCSMVKSLLMLFVKVCYDILDIFMTYYSL